MNIYIGNLAPDVREDDLRQSFEPFGQIETVAIVKDKYSGESKGFGFVEMSSVDDAHSAIDGLNGKEIKGKSIIVNEARPRPQSNRNR